MTEIRIYRSETDRIFKTKMQIGAITCELQLYGFASITTITGDTLLLSRNDTTLLREVA